MPCLVRELHDRLKGDDAAMDRGESAHRFVVETMALQSVTQQARICGNPTFGDGVERP